MVIPKIFQASISGAWKTSPYPNLVGKPTVAGRLERVAVSKSGISSRFSEENNGPAGTTTIEKQLWIGWTHPPRNSGSWLVLIHDGIVGPWEFFRMFSPFSQCCEVKPYFAAFEVQMAGDVY